MVLRSPEDITINGVTLSDVFDREGGYFIVNEVSGRHIAQRALTLVSAQGQDGAHLLGSTLETRNLQIRYTMKGSSFEDLRKRMEELNGILLIDELLEIQFADEPDRIYYGVVSGGNEDVEKSMVHKGTIEIIRPDPYKYGFEKTQQFVNGAASVDNMGNYETYPYFTMNVLNDITFLDLFTENNYMRIGQPAAVDEAPVIRKRLVLSDPMESTTLWSVAPSTEFGTVMGTISSNGYSFRPDTFGTSANSWHGPAVQRAVPEAPLQDYMVEVRIRMDNPTVKHLGRIVIELLDDMGAVVARMNMNKNKAGRKGNEGVVRVGPAANGVAMIATTGEKGVEWKNFDGIMRIRKSRNVWDAYIAQINTKTGKHHSRAVGRYVDAANAFNRPLAQVRVAFAIYGSTTPAPMFVHDLKVYEMNGDNPNAAEIIASAGDVIEIDHVNDLIAINGEPRIDLKDFGGTFFPLNAGLNTIFVEPAANVAGSLSWREKYL